MVSIVAFQAVDRGSIPRQRILFMIIYLTTLSAVYSQQNTAKNFRTPYSVIVSFTCRFQGLDHLAPTLLEPQLG